MSDRGIPTVSGLSDVDLDRWDFDAIVSPHQPDYDSIGGCVCGESYPCTTRELVAEVRRLREARHQDLRLLLQAGRDLTDVEAERDRLRDGIRALHVPRDEEIERFHGPYPQDGDLEGDCPDADPLGCVGHIETIQVCAECGHDNDGDSALFRPWPCPTVALLDDQPSQPFRERGCDVNPYSRGASMKMLIVPSLSLSPLSTAGPLPTDGQPEWWRCECGHRARFGVGYSNPRHHHSDDDLGSMAPDGPYPFTVAVWQERAAAQCPGCGCYLPTEDECQPCWSCGTYVPEAVGAVVATVEVTGPSHQPYLGLHHDRCSLERLCHPDALPDCWHTPTSTVTRLDVPIPMERPHAQVDVQRLEDPEPSTIDGVPEPWWWADLDLEVARV